MDRLFNYKGILVGIASVYNPCAVHAIIEIFIITVVRPPPKHLVTVMTVNVGVQIAI